MIGITPVLQAQMTLVGSLRRLSMTHALQAGVSQTVAAMVCGVRPILKIRATIAQTRACSSAPASALQSRGTPPLVFAALMGRWALSATAATIGQLLLMVSLRTAFTSTTMDTSPLRFTLTEQTGSLFGASKNNPWYHYL